nr:helix-turn-helix transcriptional regulator [Bacillus paralicheniformis]
MQVSLYQEIEKIRKDKGITKIHISRSFNKTPAWYSAISKGKRQLKADDLEKMAEILGVAPKDFFK